MRAAAADLLGTRIGDLLDEDRLTDALDAALGLDWQAELSAPLLRALAPKVARELHARTEPVEELLPGPASQALEALAADAELIRPSLIAVLLEDPAVEAVIHDLLLDALRQFSHRVNPFTADWGLPALLKLLPPVGFGKVRSAFEARRAEFEQRLEPEMRRFLSGFSRRAVQQLADRVLTKQGEPEFVALRKRMLAALLRRPLRELVWAPDDPKMRHLVEAACALLEGQELRPVLRAELLRMARDWLAENRDLTVGDALGRVGAGLPDLVPAVRPFYPAITRLLALAAGPSARSKGAGTVR